MEVIKKMRLITGGQHLITLQRFPLHRTTPTPAGLAGELLLHGTGRIWPLDAKSQRATLNQELGVKPIRF